jgi:LPXTG-motif cell wall-anchored protein
LTEEIIGYTLANQGVNGIYTSNYDAYDIDINADTATNPLHYSDFKEDKEGTEYWSRTATLNSGNNWKANWTKTDLNEATGKRYIYYIEETDVRDGNKVIDITNASDHKSGEAKDYLVTYSGNDVAANDENNPILITNEYIWYKLPATGGSGTGRIYFLGGIFTAIGIISGSALYRRKRRRV